MTMNRITAVFAAVALSALTGCFGPPKPYSVYGSSGTAYTAPDTCAALTKCLLTEKSCYYDRTLFRMADGSVQESECKEVKAK